jgi:hypothetical protein
MAVSLAAASGTSSSGNGTSSAVATASSGTVSDLGFCGWYTLSRLRFLVWLGFKLCEREWIVPGIDIGQVQLHVVCSQIISMVVHNSKPRLLGLPGLPNRPEHKNFSHEYAYPLCMRESCSTHHSIYFGPRNQPLLSAPHQDNRITAAPRGCHPTISNFITSVR